MPSALQYFRGEVTPKKREKIDRRLMLDKPFTGVVI